MQPEAYSRPAGQNSVQAELDRRQSSRLRRKPGGGLSTDKHMDKLDKSPRLRGRARVSVISGSGSTGSPFKKVRSDVNLDRADSPDYAKRLSRPKFDHLNANDQRVHNNLPRVQTVQFGEHPEVTALDSQRDGHTSPVHSEGGVDGGLSQGPSYSQQTDFLGTMDRKHPIQVYGQGCDLQSQGSGPHLQSIAGRVSTHTGVPASQRGFDDQSARG